MTDKELIELLLKLEIIEENWGRYFVGRQFICNDWEPNKILSDGRVVVSVLQKVAHTIDGLPSRYAIKVRDWYSVRDFYDPRNIIELCCEELKKLT